jgi:molybdate transport system ATP-binding protein
MSSAAIPFSQPAREPSLHVEAQKRFRADQHSCFQLQVAFTARPGVTILVGRSGAGKSTLLRTIAGLSKPEKGRIAIAGRVLFDSEKKINVEPAKRKVAFVFQDLALFPHLTVQENVSYGLRTLGRAEQKRRVTEILRSFQIAQLCDRMPREISGGEQQRVALARSLVTDPSVLLLDEPLSSLDAHTKAGIIDDLRAWNQVHRIPMLYVTHNHEEVLALGEHAISLELGQIAVQGAPMSVVSTPYRLSLAHLAGFENIFEAEVVETRERQGTMICRIAGTCLEIHTALTHVLPGLPVHVGIKAEEILLALNPPTFVSNCNVIQGKVKQVDSADSKVEVLIDCGTEFRAHLPVGSESLNLSAGDTTYLIIRPQSCHLIRPTRLRASQRLFVFICNRNIRRSPVAAAICNAEIARRLKVPRGVFQSLGVRVVSAGLNATPGDSMAIEAEEALNQLQVPIPYHRSQRLSPELVNKAELIFCMTESERLAVLTLFPESVSKTLCLQPGVGVEDPHDELQGAFLSVAKQLHELIGPIVDRILAPVDIAKPA